MLPTMNDQLIARLVKPTGNTGAYQAIHIAKHGSNILPEGLEITFRRTLRVADASQTYELPPGLAPFPIYSVNGQKGDLPKSVIDKGGVFIPIYRKL